MKLAIRANELMKDELLVQGLSHSPELKWVNDFVQPGDVDAYIDLLFEPAGMKGEDLSLVPSFPVIVNAVTIAPGELPDNYVRINAWPTFLQRPIVEAACASKIIRDKTENIFNCFNKKIEWVPDTPGFISARVISMIINEAYYALQENVSTREEIDLAMKLGTNYPYGPFEWSRKIGLLSIHELLIMLARKLPRYSPSLLMSEEAMKA